MKTLACHDMGIDCPYVAKGMTDEEVMGKLKQHGATAHSMTAKDMTPDMEKKMRDSIKNE